MYYFTLLHIRKGLINTKINPPSVHITKMGKKFGVGSHTLVPKHIKLNDTEVKKLFEKYSITAKELPKILKTDPAAEELNVNAGDIIKIVRESKTAGETVYYREVVNE